MPSRPGADGGPPPRARGGQRTRRLVAGSGRLPTYRPAGERRPRCAPVLWAVPPRCALPACRTHAVNVVGSASACWPRRRHIGAGLRLAPPPLPDRILRSAHPCHRRCLEPGAGAVFSLAAIPPLWTLPPTTAAVRLCFAPPPALPPRCHVFDTFHCSWDGHGGRASPQQRARQPSAETRRRRHTWRGRRRHRDYPAAPSPLLATPREPPPNRLALLHYRSFSFLTSRARRRRGLH